jgi:hypothetical protein
MERAKALAAFDLELETQEQTDQAWKDKNKAERQQVIHDDLSLLRRN